jgi:hypothetical protein
MWAMLLALVGLSRVIPDSIPLWNAAPAQPAASLYLMEKASQYVKDTESFETAVRETAAFLDIPPEWLMAVMYSESRLNPAAVNFKGSGATGLIQFMVPVVRELNVKLGTRYYMKDIQQMPAHRQMELVRAYLQTVRERHGEFETLTDLYLGILYPRAMRYGDHTVMYARPSLTYTQNAGLDENRDGRVTRTDIDQRMKRLYPEAYHTDKGGQGSWFQQLSKMVTRITPDADLSAADPFSVGNGW